VEDREDRFHNRGFLAYLDRPSNTLVSGDCVPRTPARAR
jgi:hypothetical protein